MWHSTRKRKGAVPTQARSRGVHGALNQWVRLPSECGRLWHRSLFVGGSVLSARRNGTGMEGQVILHQIQKLVLAATRIRLQYQVSSMARSRGRICVASSLRSSLSCPETMRQGQHLRVTRLAISSCCAATLCRCCVRSASSRPSQDLLASSEQTAETEARVRGRVVPCGQGSWTASETLQHTYSTLSSPAHLG